MFGKSEHFHYPRQETRRILNEMGKKLKHIEQLADECSKISVEATAIDKLKEINRLTLEVEKMFMDTREKLVEL